MKKIDFEAHFYIREYLDALVANNDYPRLVEPKGDQGRRRRLAGSDVAHGRIIPRGGLAFIARGRPSGPRARLRKTVHASRLRSGGDSVDPMAHRRGKNRT